jgi:cytochrome c553
MRCEQSLVIVAAIVALMACTRPPGQVARPPDDPAENATAKGEPSPATQSTRSDAGTLHETAREYLDRRAAEKRGAPAEGLPGTGSIAACLLCHGQDAGGKRTLETPRIGGLPEWYLARELNYFKQGVRGASDEDSHGIVMRAMVMLIGGEREIEDLAAYLSTLRPPPAKTVDGGNAAHGEQLYMVCMACHGPDARGSADLNTPNLVDQDGEYIVRQLDNFRAGIRGTNPLDVFGQQMRPVAAAMLMSHEDAVDVAAYIGTLRGGDSSESKRSTGGAGDGARTGGAP